MNTTSAVLLLVGLFAVIFTLSVPIGIYMSAVFDGTLSQKFPWMYRVESIFSGRSENPAESRWTGRSTAFRSSR